jgi:1,4-alpha-glucan branching enzyme
MAITVHHQPVNPTQSYSLHLWGDLAPVDVPGAPAGDRIDFALPALTDARKSQFKFRATDPVSHRDVWEDDSFVRTFRLAAPTDVWTFEFSARILYHDPSPSGVSYKTGDLLTFNLITRNRFVGGRLYAWNPYDPSKPDQYFPETSNAGGISVFQLALSSWMTGGFHFKFVGPKQGDSEYWEPDSANRVWRPVDGGTLWMKGNQVNVRRTPLSLTAYSIEALFPAAVSMPVTLNLYDPADDFNQALTPSVADYPASARFKVGSYSASIYPGAIYTLTVGGIEGSSPYVRPFPSPLAAAGAPSRLIVGNEDWITAFPPVVAENIAIEPRPGSTCFAPGVSVQIATQIGPPHQTAAATRQADGTYTAAVDALQGIRNAIWLSPVSGPETQLYAWIDKSRYFTPQAAGATFYTAEGVFGLSMRGTPNFAEPPLSRQVLMDAAFGTPVARGGVFPSYELPHGPTPVGTDVYFVIHAPHAVTASLILVDENAPGGGLRRPPVPMQLTADTRYWWCKVDAGLAPPETRYRFLLNEVDEVMDPAARNVFDSGNFDTTPQDDPRDVNTSWTVILDAATVRAAAHQAPWKTMGWDSLVVYELHAKRFTDENPGGLAPLDVIAGQLGPGKYLSKLPVTAIELLPLNEFKSTNSWGYNTAFYFAVESSYGGAAALAHTVNAAHASGRAVMLDLVYNHSLDSPLMNIARDVYRNGDAWGDRMNSGHPMVQEFLRQAIVYHLVTFGLDGFRFDDTKTILSNIGGWDFLAIIRNALRGTATALGQSWPYCVAENERDDKKWDISNPAWSIVDGVWHIDEVYKIRDCTYDPWQASDDHAPALAGQMVIPQSWYRPFFEATRFGESHDMVSGQDPANQRIASRPPFRQGFQMSKAIGALVLFSNGVPMLFMGQEVAETRFFSFDNNGPVTNPQDHDLPPGAATDQTRVLAWFRSLLGMRNDGYKGLRGDSNVMNIRMGHRTIAFSCGYGGSLFVVVTMGTTNQRQDSSWLGLPAGGTYKEIFNSSWPDFQVEFESQQSNGGYDARISTGAILNLPYIGAVVLERR